MRYQKRFILASFPVSMIKYSNKNNVWIKGLFCLLFQEYSPSWQRCQGNRSRDTLSHCIHPQETEQAVWLLLSPIILPNRTHFSPYRVQSPSHCFIEISILYIFSLFSFLLKTTLTNAIKAIIYRYTWRPTFQGIIDFVKLTININHHKIVSLL